MITATTLLDEWLEQRTAPDLLVLDPSAHQAKWARNFTEFKEEVPGLVKSITKYHRMVRCIPMFRFSSDDDDDDARTIVSAVRGGQACVLDDIPSFQGTLHKRR